MKKPGSGTFAQILKTAKEEPCRRMAAKVPEWVGIEGMQYPTLLCTEQCSGSAAAFIKAGEAKALCPAGEFEIADLTAGIGVDSWAFCTAGARVLHNEMDPRLSAAARHNFSLLGMSGIEFSNTGITVQTAPTVLSAFFKVPDHSRRICFLDPARRSASGSKVFRIQECSPNVLELVPALFEHCRFIIVKLSPMADIDLCVKELGNCRKAICTGAGNECKELLFILDRDYTGQPTVQVRENDFEMSFTREQEKAAGSTFCDPETLVGKYLFEPGKALSKAGAFKLLSERFHLEKLDISTQLYCSREPIHELAKAGKWFKISDSAKFSKASLREFADRYPQCEISARNIPVSSDELRARMKLRSGGNLHLFATQAAGERILILGVTANL